MQEIAERRRKHMESFEGLFWELNPGPLAPEARIMPLDQTANRDEGQRHDNSIARENRKRAVLGIEPRTSRTQSENHATRPNSHWVR